MKKIKSILVILALVLAFSLVLVGCGEKATPAETPATETETTEAPVTETPAEEAPAATTVLKIGASPSPHGEILAVVAPILAEQGITLEISEFSDYVLPNIALADGSLDANYFQHEPYLIDFNAGNGTDLVSAAFIHYEPMGIYPGKTATLAEIADGAVIAVPNDATNEARALLLLEAQGLIKLEEGVGIEATPKNITENPHNLKIEEVEASQTPAVLPDVDFSVINSNFALSAGVIDTGIVSEDENSVAVDYANVIAVKPADLEKPEIKALVEALKSEEVKKFISEKYKGSVVVYEG